MERRSFPRERRPSLSALSDASAVNLERENSDENIAWGMAKKEARTVCIQKTVFISVFIVVAVGITTFIYVTTFSREKDSFETNFDYLAQKLTADFSLNSQIKHLTAYSISVSMTSDALFYNQTWPNVIVPDFNLRTKGSREIADTNAIVFSPVVTDESRSSWEAFVVRNGDRLDSKPDDGCNLDGRESSCWTLSDGIARRDENGGLVRDQGPGPYFPGLLISSSGDHARFVLFNYHSLPSFAKTLDAMVDSRAPLLTDVDTGTIVSVLVYPVFDTFETDRAVVGSILLALDWVKHFDNVASPDKGSIVAVLETGAGEILSFEIFDTSVTFLGQGSLQDPTYDDMKVTTTFSSTSWNVTGPISSTSAPSNSWMYSLSVYPSRSFEEAYVTDYPMIYTVVTAVVFAFTLVMFCIYDKVVERRNERVVGQAMRFGGILDALVPTALRNLIFTEPEESENLRPQEWAAPNRWQSFRRTTTSNDETSRMVEPAKARLRAFLSDNEKSAITTSDQYKYDEPIADLFPETTIMFADISGFTAWSSEREPSQVFYLLETMYRAFDRIAARLGVFKVETIGDCYVAVTGLPDPRKDHAVVMARFSYECLLEMSELVKALEVTLGPGTSDLAIRVGLHSGPVTAGVLRGEKARFQLFGDTMNTAARMESSGERCKIHVSQDTAEALEKAGKGHWLTDRGAPIDVKGKGQVKTWWLQPRRSTLPSADIDNDHAAIEQIPPPPDSKPFPTLTRRSSKHADNWGDLTLDIYGVDSDKKTRLVNWNVEILSELLSKLIAWRAIRSQQMRRRRSQSGVPVDGSQSSNGDEDESYHGQGMFVIDEVSEIIKLPRYTEKMPTLGQLNSDSSLLSEEVKNQLYHYISRVCDYYRNVPFHNLEHASHVTLSANKLMKRIISPGESDFNTQEVDEGRKRLRKRRSIGDISRNLESVERNLHVSTFGISADPLCQFAIVFSALIHDIDHTGLPNAQLIKENRPIACKYMNKSVAEQNSVDIAWSILMEDQYHSLRECIFENNTERRRFRQLVVNSVMATDIVDKELKMLRENRWATAFDESKIGSMSDTDVNRKATIVIEHIIQASDVAHTMQHWHIYCKWNEKLFCELYTAYLSGHAEKDPSTGWYGGEIWFFDNYIIPLAKKLKECGVFGVASDEYLSYAEENRKEWERKGKVIVATMLRSYHERHGKTKLNSTATSRGGQEEAEGNGHSIMEERNEICPKSESPGTPERVEQVPNLAEQMRRAQQVFSDASGRGESTATNTSVGSDITLN